MKVVLASKSPRREELLKMIIPEFLISQINIDETILDYTDVNDYVKQIVYRKKQEAMRLFPEYLCVCADTIVCLDDIILEKPQDKHEAYQMISLLNNRDHRVLTGVCLVDKNKCIFFVEETIVSVVEMSDEEIIKYIETNEPYDKAGGYGIQGQFARFISKIEGDYYNVMGLPVARVYQEIKKFI